LGRAVQEYQSLRFVKRCGGAVALIFLGTISGCGDAQSPQDVARCGGTEPLGECHTLSVGGVTREYLLHVPASFSPNTGSLVIALHGVGDLALQMSARSGLNATADDAGFAVAYPNALVGQSGVAEWNVYFSEAFPTNPPDDVAFIRELIVRLQQQLALDPKRIYVAGFSNGGLMAHRVAAELADLVAAVGVVAGTLGAITGTASQVPDALQPVSLILLHGDRDERVPCCPFKRGITLDAAFDYWISPRANDCQTVDAQEPICEAPETPSTLPRKRGTQCSGGVEVAFYHLLGGMHRWYTVPMNVANAEPYNPLLDSTTGVTTNDILWNFFAAHPKP
jgi:polyhydroxybutyrate depolymerase